MEYWSLIKSDSEAINYDMVLEQFVNPDGSIVSIKARYFIHFGALRLSIDIDGNEYLYIFTSNRQEFYTAIGQLREAINNLRGDPVYYENT